MKILYIGSGYVGTCSAAISADSGHDVLVYDIDDSKIKKLGSNDIDQIESCLFEKGLGEMLLLNKERIKFSSNYDEVIESLESVDAIFLCLPTPEKNNSEGESDLSFYYQATEKLADNLLKRNNGEQSKYVVIVNKSTVPINMVRETSNIMNSHGVKNIGVVSNPEFLVEGKAMEGSVRPDRIIIGAESEKDFAVMREVYGRFHNATSIQYIEVNPFEAAAGKLLANFLLFNRLANTFSVMGRVCESFADVRFENVRKIITSDPRIGTWGFYDSVYAGGSCFIKDAASLAHQIEEAGGRAHQVRLTLEENKFQRDYFYSRAEKEASFSWKGKTIAILGVAFKQGTNDVRNSPAFDIVNHLIADGVAAIKVYDPTALPMFKSFLSKNGSRDEKINYTDSEEQALEQSDACIILTDWPQFSLLGEKIEKVCSAPYLVMDGRRILQGRFESLQKKGYSIISVGSPFLPGNKL
ncbi:MAG: UDP-glucose/GDP-mannose dehydrogenase family protein [Candidatus Magasanikbacteria bacterium]|nr:UDP-glucose/GDP-mannose dehydrogenase family protein [Candidatus Magasanikbacteria bacterium]